MKKNKFKSIYFPANSTDSNLSTRITISLPTLESSDLKNWPLEFIESLSELSGSTIRKILGDPTLEHLESLSKLEHRSLSNVVVSLLLKKYDENSNIFLKNRKNQMKSVGVTFSDSLKNASHGWYPYVEGFSSKYVHEVITSLGQVPEKIYDPFGGSGTTQLTASMLGIKSFYSELNPFMVEVCEAKTTAAYWARNNIEVFSKSVSDYISLIREDNLVTDSLHVDLSEYYKAFPDRDFFEENNIRQLMAAIQHANSFTEINPKISQLFRIACAANAVNCSNMTRRADLRRRRPDEYKNRIINVSKCITDSVKRMLHDIESYPEHCAETKFISDNARCIPDDYINSFDIAVTSPPYLNGTNYFRNTKIELWLLSHISSEKELKSFREKTVTGGINDVYDNPHYKKFENVEKVAKELDLMSKDKRIPKMVRHYFSDMYEVLKNVHKTLKTGGRLILDIGDSKFYGVYVPTHRLLTDVALEIGFELEHEKVLARRLSRDKSELTQVELILRKMENNANE